MKIIHRIAYLIRRAGIRQLSTSEQSELDRWLQTLANQALYEQLSDPKEEAKKMAQLQGYDSHKAYLTFRKKVEPRSLWVYMRWAACFLLPLALGIGIWLSRPAGSDMAPEATTVQLLAGEQKAILTLSGGRKIELGGPNKSQIIREGGTEIRIDSSSMQYMAGEEKEENKLNNLYVPRKGEYSMVLADGTRVFLNSDSRLVYPVTFGKQSREVTLEGEAFFEVAQDTARPFIVKSGAMQITVLGTKFNLKTYTEEKDIVTTLVEGKVVFSNGQEQMEMKPGEQVCYTKTNGAIIKHKVDVSVYTSWREGLLKFERENLENILTTLSRWYDVTIFYENAGVKEQLFTGDLKRYASINEHLKMLEMTTNVHFTINKDVVFVK